MQLAMLRKLLSAALITEEEYEKILGTLRKEYDILLGKIDMITGQVEKVIIGGYDEEGNKDPCKITFIYKTGFKNGVDHSKKKYEKLCSDRTREVDTLCSHNSADAASVYAGERRGDNAGTQPFWGDLRKWDKQPDPNLIQRWLM